jgi:hypothetical protein
MYIQKISMKILFSLDQGKHFNSSHNGFITSLFSSENGNIHHSSFVFRTFGEVYRAVNKRSGQKVAIKKMLLTPKREPLFISEINVQRNTEHPNVVKLFDAYKVGVSEFSAKFL